MPLPSQSHTHTHSSLIHRFHPFWSIRLVILPSTLDRMHTFSFYFGLRIYYLENFERHDSVYMWEWNSHKWCGNSTLKQLRSSCILFAMVLCFVIPFDLFLFLYFAFCWHGGTNHKWTSLICKSRMKWNLTGANESNRCNWKPMTCIEYWWNDSN